MKQMKIDRETKIVLLKAMKSGYFELSDLEHLITNLYKDLLNEELSNWIKDLSLKLGIEPITIEVIDRREQAD
jgi:predicted metal-dependent hydrolase